MRNLILLLFFVISGCYIDNGAPHSNYYWKKDGKKLSYEDIMYCSPKVNEKSSKVYVNPSCYYDLGYRFTAPIYWCLSLDSSINKEVCEQYKKYRN